VTSGRRMSGQATSGREMSGRRMSGRRMSGRATSGREMSGRRMSGRGDICRADRAAGCRAGEHRQGRRRRAADVKMMRDVVKKVLSGLSGGRLPGNPTLRLTREHKKTPPGIARRGFDVGSASTSRRQVPIPPDPMPLAPRDGSGYRLGPHSARTLTDRARG